MNIDALFSLEIIEVLENFIDRKRPPEEIRHKLDLSYKIEDQSVTIFEIRPRWDNYEEKMECFVAKATFVKNQNIWKIFWQRSDAKWHQYMLKSKVNTLEEFITLVEEDKNGCFWG